MDGPALATHSELGNRAGVADRGRCEHRPEWLDRAESFPAGRSDRIGIADTLRSAAQPRGRRLEAGRSAGCVHGTGIAGRSVAGIDLRSRSDGGGSGDLQETNAADDSQYRAHFDLIVDVQIAGDPGLARQSGLSESSVRVGSGDFRIRLLGGHEDSADQIIFDSGEGDGIGYARDLFKD